MAEELVQITKYKFDKGKSDRGCCNKKQFLALGVEYPLTKGWYRNLINSFVPVVAYEKFLSLRNSHLKRKNKPKPKGFLY
jgi:hypothetical protein